MARARMLPHPEVPGLASRRVAVEMLDAVLRRHRPLDEQLDPRLNPPLAALAARDRALVHRLVATVLRRRGTLRALLSSFLDRGLPQDAPRLEMVLLVGAAQVLWLDVPDHAAVDLAVRLVQTDRRAGKYTGLVNAVLRGITQHGAARIAELDATALDTPDWLLTRWTRQYGAETARAIAVANSHEPALDVTAKADAAFWAIRMRGEVLPTGSIRSIAHGPVSMLPGFDEGAWWVQNAAAALPVRLLGDVAGLSVADLCAAPGGKTAQLAAAGATVTAVDRSDLRMRRLRENLTRLQLEAETVVADAAEWQAGPFDAVLLDAPCLSTGTIRRHPDIAWLKQEVDMAGLVALQRRLLDAAVALTKPGGTIVYCTCSLEPEEGPDQIAALLERNPDVVRRPVAAGEINQLSELLTESGDLRTLPCHLPAADPRLGGLDGFYAARLQRA